MELRCKALLFDLDGVLVDSRAVVERTWQRWAERHGIDPAPFLAIAHGRRAFDTLRAVAPHLATKAEVTWLDDTERVDVESLRALPGAVQLLSSLPRDRWAIVTSCDLVLARVRLGAAGVPLPDVFVVSDDVQQGKPAPEGYRLAAHRLALDPGECIVFEDAPAGVAAGLAAGARVIGLTTTHAARDLPGVVTAIPNLAAVHVRAERDGLVIR
ncbi:MAG: HAD-IA family hydrolase [Gemmatimonadales bacterium]